MDKDVAEEIPKCPKPLQVSPLHPGILSLCLLRSQSGRHRALAAQTPALLQVPAAVGRAVATNAAVLPPAGAVVAVHDLVPAGHLVQAGTSGPLAFGAQQAVVVPHLAQRLVQLAVRAVAASTATIAGRQIS